MVNIDTETSRLQRVYSCSSVNPYNDDDDDNTKKNRTKNTQGIKKNDRFNKHLNYCDVKIKGKIGYHGSWWNHALSFLIFE